MCSLVQGKQAIVANSQDTTKPPNPNLDHGMAGSRMCSATNDGGLYAVARGSIPKSQKMQPSAGYFN
jgi:hypothetical protein